MISRRLSKLKVLSMLILFFVPLLAAFSAAESITAALPPRPTAELVKSNQPSAYIELQLSGATVGSDGVWTIVQWVDEFGDWHDVVGWQGTVELDGTQTWWVAPDDLGKGPFRWQVYDSPTGDVIATSDEFMLPGQKRYVLVVPVEVAE